MISTNETNANYEAPACKTDGLNVLMIGNSFSEDAVRWIYDIAMDLGIKDVNVCNMYIGGCSLDTHYNNAVNNNASYDFQQYKNGEWTHDENKTLEYGIRYAKWDYITLQQSSGVSGIATSYENLQNLMDYVKQTATNPSVRLVWHMTWAYSADSTHGDFAKYDKDQMKMYNAIVDCVKTQVLTKDFYKIIPNGTAIQNIRSSYVGDTLTRDGFHLSLGLGRYVAGLGLICALTDADISRLNFLPPSVPDAYKQVIFEGVLGAAKKPYEVTESLNATSPEFVASEKIESAD